MRHSDGPLAQIESLPQLGHVEAHAELLPERLAGAIRELLDDDERACAMGERGRRAVEDMYSWGSQAGALLDLYKELLA